MRTYNKRKKRKNALQNELRPEISYFYNPRR